MTRIYFNFTHFIFSYNHVKNAHGYPQKMLKELFFVNIFLPDIIVHYTVIYY